MLVWSASCVTIARAVENHIPYNVEHRVVWPDKTERVLLELSTIVYDDAGKPLKMLGVVQDITHRKKVETFRNCPILLPPPYPRQRHRDGPGRPGALLEPGVGRDFRLRERRIL